MYNVGSVIVTLGNIYMDVMDCTFNNISSQMGGAVMQTYESAIDMHYVFSDTLIWNCFAVFSTVFYIKSENILTLHNCTLLNNYASDYAALGTFTFGGIL